MVYVCAYTRITCLNREFQLFSKHCLFVYLLMHLSISLSAYLSLYLLCVFKCITFVLLLITVYVPLLTPPECYVDTDCAKDRSCVNQICLNPCLTGNPCASGAFCHVQDHTPICSCPAGYEGNPRVECRPRTLQLLY
jgi:hypothetical protein